MAQSWRSQPRAVRARRRARMPDVRARRPLPGRHHPVSAVQVRAALAAFGADAYYGVRSVMLVPGRERLLLGRLVGPGEIELYDQPLTPWRLGVELEGAELERLRAAGADVGTAGVVDWPASTLADFMLGHVLAHELGHHILQHERRLKGHRATRTREHEAQADSIAAVLRAKLSA